MTNNNDYNAKYIKYKSKYMQLKALVGGGGVNESNIKYNIVFIPKYGNTYGVYKDKDIYSLIRWNDVKLDENDINLLNSRQQFTYEQILNFKHVKFCEFIISNLFNNMVGTEYKFGTTLISKGRTCTKLIKSGDTITYGIIIDLTIEPSISIPVIDENTHTYSQLEWKTKDQLNKLGEATIISEYLAMINSRC